MKDAPWISMLMQESRKARLKTPLGDNALAITRFDGQEGISELFEYRIEDLQQRRS
jgi:type VI secretion system secreted protein VgrG